MSVEREPIDDSEVAEILRLLRQRNLVQTEGELLAELKEAAPESGRLAFNWSAEGESNLRTTAYTAECNLALCFDEYERYLKWAIGAEPEGVRAQACALLFPLFCHMCIDLLAAGRMPKFRAFVRRFASEQMPFYADYVRCLERLKDSDNLANNQFTTLLRTNRFVVTLSTEAEEAIAHAVKTLSMVRAVLHTHVSINRSSKAPLTVDEHERSAGYLLGDPPPWVNETALQLGVYSFTPEPGVLQSARLCLEREGSMEMLKRGYVGARLGQLTAGPSAPPLHHLPLPPISRDEELDHLVALVDRDHCKPLSNNEKPSIYFYTILDQCSSPCSLDLTRDGQFLATGNSDSSVSLYFLSPEALGSVKDLAPEESLRFRGHSAPVHGVAFQNDKQLLLSCSSDSTCRLWAPREARLLNTFRLGSASLWDVAFSPLSGYFAVGSSDGVALLYSLVREKPCRIFHGHIGSVGRVHFHPNGHYVVTGSDDRTSRLWDIRSGQCVRIFTGSKSDVHSLSFANDGRSLAIGTADGEVLYVDVGQAKLIYDFQTPTGAVCSLAHSADDQVLAMASLEDQVIMRSLSQDGAVRCFPTKSTPVLHVQFTRRNLLLAFGHLACPVGLEFAEDNSKSIEESST